MRAPDFWQRDGLLPWTLAPLGLCYHLAGQLRSALVTPWQAPVPVLCVGNLVAGGAGKTPVALSLLSLLADRGLKPAALSRGYGGAGAGPLQVDPEKHDAGAVGDEALLLAARAPTWVARDRIAGAKAAVADGADVLVMDDGFQNPSLHKDICLLVIDAAYGLGNGHLLPAGPLRERPADGFARADAVVLVGADPIAAPLQRLAGDLPVLRARLVPQDHALAGQPVFAFAGIGRPEKFFQTLRELGAKVVGTKAFADHQPYSAAELEALRQTARGKQARLVTTAKDAARLGKSLPADIDVLDVELAWDDPPALARLLKGLFPATAGASAP